MIAWGVVGCIEKRPQPSAICNVIVAGYWGILFTPSSAQVTEYSVNILVTHERDVTSNVRFFLSNIGLLPMNTLG